MAAHPEASRDFAVDSHTAERAGILPRHLPREVKVRARSQGILPGAQTQQQRIVTLVAARNEYSSSKKALTRLGWLNREWRTLVVPKLFQHIRIDNELDFYGDRRSAELLREKLRALGRFREINSTWPTFAPYIETLETSLLIDVSFAGHLPQLRRLSLSNIGWADKRTHTVIPAYPGSPAATLLALGRAPQLTNLRLALQRSGTSRCYAFVIDCELLDALRVPLCRQLTELDITYDPKVHLPDETLIWLLSALADIVPLRKLSLTDVLGDKVDDLSLRMDVRRRYDNLEIFELSASDDDRPAPDQPSSAREDADVATADAFLFSVLSRCGAKLRKVVIDGVDCLEERRISLPSLTGLEEVRIVRCFDNARLVRLFSKTALRRLILHFWVPYSEDVDFDHTTTFKGMDDLAELDAAAVFAADRFTRLEYVELDVRQWHADDDWCNDIDTFAVANDEVADSIFQRCTEMETVLGSRSIQVQRHRTALMPPQDPRYLPRFCVDRTGRSRFARDVEWEVARLEEELAAREAAEARGKAGQ